MREHPARRDTTQPEPEQSMHHILTFSYGTSTIEVAPPIHRGSMGYRDFYLEIISRRKVSPYP
jgi:hypothetical protein